MFFQNYSLLTCKNEQVQTTNAPKESMVKKSYCEDLPSGIKSFSTVNHLLLVQQNIIFPLEVLPLLPNNDGNMLQIEETFRTIPYALTPNYW